MSLLEVKDLIATFLISKPSLCFQHLSNKIGHVDQSYNFQTKLLAPLAGHFHFILLKWNIVIDFVISLNS